MVNKNIESKIALWFENQNKHIQAKIYQQQHKQCMALFDVIQYIFQNINNLLNSNEHKNKLIDKKNTFVISNKIPNLMMRR